ncbi:sensor domain-containing protein [Magnetospirillum fulvum]|uniref:Diguanylate cyclase (GGDEF) domain-containing protein n=1 Tax=Magnetospirillum fulvum TaxID=1082 RepID=A0A1H6IXQ6_MAGFU|nr:EAL domain-containing protein [Magnetospirillum fulvum]SEH51245.1 diguanylate cyclase (GGDEF) domain-containing protein [Magnetospirillum fulvum]
MAIRDDIISACDLAVDMASDAILLLDEDWSLVRANPAATCLLGLGSDYHGRPLNDFVTDASERVDPTRNIRFSRSSGEPLIVKFPAERRNGATFPVLLRALPQISAERLVAFATRDPITGLLNRDAIEDHVHSLIESSGLAQFGVLVIQVDRFGLFAEASGRSYADLLLRAFAQCLKRIATPDCTVGYLSAATFAVVIAEPDQPDALDRYANRLHQVLKAPLVIEHHDFLVGASIGTASWPADCADAEGILNAAELAANVARRDGGARTQRFKLSILEDVRTRVELEADLRLAIERNEFLLYFQPKVEWPSGRLVGFEALLRWRHPVKGMISPDLFIPLAEANGMIVPLGRWVMREACSTVAAWLRQGLSPVPVSVNVSPVQLVEDDIDELLRPLADFAVPLDLIEIELTESAMMDVIQQNRGLIAALKASNLRIAIDDFGTGHSSLGSLRRLPIDIFKIDRSFVQDTGHSNEAREIVTMIVAMARALALDVVVEGVETQEQADFLLAQGAEIMQGYLFSPPAGLETATGWLQRHQNDDIFAAPLPTRGPSLAGSRPNSAS